MLTYKPIDDLTFQSMYAVLQGGMKLLNDLERFLSPYGLSQGRFAIMLALIETNGHIVSPSHLAELTGKSRPTVTKMVDRLLKDGLVLKGTGALDGRSKTLVLSDKGEDLLNEIIPLYNKRILEMSDPLSEVDKTQLISLICKIAFHESSS